MKTSKHTKKPELQEIILSEGLGAKVRFESKSKQGWVASVISLFALSLITFFVYFPSLSYPFQFDDLANISKKFDIRFFDWKEHFFRYSRWVGEVLNRLNYKFGEYCRFGGGGFDPYYYRFFNVFMHILTGLVLCAFVYRLFSRLSDDSFLKKYSWPISLTASALFLLHPVQTQTVSYIIQARLEGLATLFILATLWCIAVALQTNSRFVYWSSYIAGLFLAFVSCGTKEIVIVLPLLSVLIDLFFIARGDLKQVLRRAVFHGLLGVIILATLIKYIQPDFFMKIIGMKASVANNRGNMLNDSYAHMITPWHFFISEFKVILHYLAIFFMPTGLSVEYDWKMVDGFWAIDCIFPGFVLFSMIAASVWYWFKKPKSMTVFSFAWFIIGVAPRSTFMPSPELICDYKTYLASIGVFIWMAVALMHVYEWICAYDFFSHTHSVRRVQTYAASIVCVLGLGFSAYERNLTWATPVSLWLDIVNKAPKKARGHNNLGVALSEAGRYEEALPCFVKAIMIDKQYSDPYSNAAVVYSVKGDDDRAIQCLKEAVRLNPEYAEAQNNLGSLLIKKGDLVAAELCLKNAVLIRPYYGKAWFNLGRLYLEQKENDKAWQHFVKATQGDLDTPNAYDILGQIGLQIGKYEQASVAFEEALKRSKGMYFPQTKFNLANAFFLTNRLSEARQIFEELFDRHPADHRFGYNLAETMFFQGDFKSAYPIFKSIAEQSFDILPNAPMRTAQCLEKQGNLNEAIEYVRNILSSNKSSQVSAILTPEKQRLELAAHLKESGGVLTAQDLQRFLGNNQSENPVSA